MLRQVGARLADARVRAGLSQADVARRLGMTRPQTIGDWETGDGNISVGALAQMCELYGVSSDFVLGLSQMPMLKGSGGIVHLGVERAILGARSWPDAEHECRRLHAVAAAGIIFGYPVPPDFEVVAAGEWRARKDALETKLQRLAKEPGGPQGGRRNGPKT